MLFFLKSSIMKRRMKKREGTDMAKDMTQGSLAKSLLAFSVPLILSGLLQQLFNWADALIVGNVEGDLALAAIGAAGTIPDIPTGCSRNP